MAIRALDYCPPTDITFADYLSALLTIDREVVPDRQQVRLSRRVAEALQYFDITHAAGADADGTWKLFDKELMLQPTHFDSMLRDPEEVFRFIWENRTALEDRRRRLCSRCSRCGPRIRIGPDGFVLRETVVEYVQIMTLQARELKALLNIKPPRGSPADDAHTHLWRRRADLQRVRPAQIPNLKPARDDRDRAAAIRPLMLRAARDIDLGMSDKPRQRAADKGARMPRR